MNLFSAKALWQITGKTNEALPVLIRALEKDNSFWAADILGMMGAAAKPAIPTLRGACKARRATPVCGRPLPCTISRRNSKCPYPYCWICLKLKIQQRALKQRNPSGRWIMIANDSSYLT